MNLNAADFVNVYKNSNEERQLASALKRLPEHERLAFVEEMLPLQPSLALSVAHKSLSEPKSFQHLLSIGLDRADASSIRVWLDSAVPRLGFRKAIAVLHEALDDHLSGVKNALYWLPAYSELPGYSAAAVAELKAEVGKKGL